MDMLSSHVCVTECRNQCDGRRELKGGSLNLQFASRGRSVSAARAAACSRSGAVVDSRLGCTPFHIHPIIKNKRLILYQTPRYSLFPYAEPEILVTNSLVLVVIYTNSTDRFIKLILCQIILYMSIHFKINQEKLQSKAHIHQIHNKNKL